MIGTIIKGIGGFYYVNTDNQIIECKARGKFRHSELTPMVGDRVDISIVNGKGTIEKILKRTSELVRPAVANVSQAIVVFAVKKPDVNVELLNKFLIICEYHKLKILVCFNKLDLIPEPETLEAIKMVEDAGYKVLYTHAKEGIGLEELTKHLEDNVSVFCGPSGVGKSTILNKVAGRELMETGEISEKLGRGKHTTRHSELIEIKNGFIVDTPGFSSIEVDFIPKEELQFYFPEFDDYLNTCKFTGCLHHKEPGCAVKDAVHIGKINESRYKLYLKLIEEQKDRRNWK